MSLEFKIEIDQIKFEDGILKILKNIRPNWDEKEVNFKVGKMLVLVFFCRA